MGATLAEFLMLIIWPLAKKVLVSMGVGYAVYTGVDAAVQAALGHAKSALGGMPADVAMLVGRFGFLDYMSIIAGAAVSALAWVQTTKLVVKATGG